MKKYEKMRKSDPILIPTCLVMIYITGMLMSALCGSADQLSFGVIILGLFTLFLLVFWIALTAGGINRICNQLFKINEIDDEEERIELQNKIQKIENYSAWIPSVILFILGWVLFKGDIFELVESFGVVGEFMVKPTSVYVLIAMAVVLIFLQVMQNKISDDSDAVKAKFTIISILVVVIGFGAAVAMFNADKRGGGSAGRYTNRYGTSTTKCIVTGCNNYIASSGDTNCCTSHSNSCLECNCYIDRDAMYCMDCIESALR